MRGALVINHGTFALIANCDITRVKSKYGAIVFLNSVNEEKVFFMNNLVNYTKETYSELFNAAFSSFFIFINNTIMNTAQTIFKLSHSAIFVKNSIFMENYCDDQFPLACIINSLQSKFYFYESKFYKQQTYNGKFLIYGKQSQIYLKNFQITNVSAKESTSLVYFTQSDIIIDGLIAENYYKGFMEAKLSLLFVKNSLFQQANGEIKKNLTSGRDVFSTINAKDCSVIYIFNSTFKKNLIYFGKHLESGVIKLIFSF